METVIYLVSGFAVGYGIAWWQVARRNRHGRR